MHDGDKWKTLQHPLSIRRRNIAFETETKCNEIGEHNKTNLYSGHDKKPMSQKNLAEQR